MNLVDDFVTTLKLPRPGDKPCAQWDRRTAIGHPMDSGLRDRRDDILAVLCKHGFISLLPWEHQCEFGCGKYPFDRPTYYMAACMALSGLDGPGALQMLAHLSALRFPADENLEIGVGGRLPWANIITRKELMIARRGRGAPVPIP
ncbi:hypothetical protein BR93DRAFT_969836 [Coniochaeta sp. PMI_546]|nr:hypothetical protein BR93DRAFT_969836 [Coniochaeta sp. PMI_546]